MARGGMDRLRRLSGRYAKSCAFCGGYRSDGLHQLAGGRRTKICAGCLRECRSLLAESDDQRFPTPSRRTIWLAQMYCSFCGRGPTRSRRFVAGPRVWICSVCAEAYGASLSALEP
ncbi:ClpX C4-type zinc finger protein [Streptomyces sp. G5(2025)]|uniref:ClpX C4-type zinc finger protein n=1 Tax=Streptomyces sp. G5(2025) TaxID=3406628 RepID=UPI003C23CF02